LVSSELPSFRRCFLHILFLLAGVACSDKGDSPRTRITSNRLQQLETNNRLLQQQLEVARAAAAAAARGGPTGSTPAGHLTHAVEADEVGRLLGLLADRDAELAMLGAELAVARAAVEALEPGERGWNGCCPWGGAGGVGWWVKCWDGAGGPLGGR
jgi:hypothetical protein